LIAEFAQLVINGLMSGAMLAVPALGFNAIYAVLRFPNFAVGGLATIGAYAGYIANVGLGAPVLPSLLAAFVAGGAVGVICDEAALRRLRPAGALPAALASVALDIVLENVVRFAFGNDLRSYDLPIFRDWRIGALRLGPQEVANAAIAVAIMAALFAFLRWTRTGKTMRAVADNASLAGLKGINAAGVARTATFIGMGLAGLGGMLTALDTSIGPLSGFDVLLAVFAACVVGGLGSIPGAVAGAFVVGLGEELSLLVLPPSYRSAIGFFAILLVLSLRPSGLLGERAA
jgi:branched-chain amino acid transport system permease protein